MSATAATGSRRVGIVGTGGIGLAMAAWCGNRGWPVAVWSPRGDGAGALRDGPLRATGVLEASVPVTVVDTAAALVAGSDIVVIAVPANGHRTVIDALVPHLQAGQGVFVSATSSLSALYLFELARSRGREVEVAASGTTVLTARRTGPAEVRVLTRRASLGLSILGGKEAGQRQAGDAALGIGAASASDAGARRRGCRAALVDLFGEVFRPDANLLASTLANTNPIAHAPLALFNWTRIERGEDWPQYHYLTPRVAGVIERLDVERQALAAAFGLAVPGLVRHLSQSFGVPEAPLAEMAAELHRRRGGPPGPVETDTRYLSEDVPFGLAFLVALGHLGAVALPATEAVVAAADLITGRNAWGDNDLIPALGIERETPGGLLLRVGVAG